MKLNLTNIFLSLNIIFNKDCNGKIISCVYIKLFCLDIYLSILLIFKSIWKFFNGRYKFLFNVGSFTVNFLCTSFINCNICTSLILPFLIVIYSSIVVSLVGSKYSFFFIVNYLKSLVILVVLTKRFQGSFFVIHDVNRQLAKHHKYSAALFGFAYPKHTTDSKILAKRIKNFAEVLC